VAHYSFLTTWLLESPREPVWEAIYAQEHWPRWWRGVEAADEVRPGDGNRVGAVSRMVWRGPLPYRVEFEVTATRVEHPHLMEADAVGDLTGVGRWRLYERDDATAVLFEWNVATAKAWMNLVAPVAHPAFKWSHDWLMARGGEGIARHLGCRLLANA